MGNLQTSEPSSGSASDMKTLLLAQKTELIGELTRAVANQFNNTMMAVTSYAELEMKRLPPSERRTLEQVLKSATRATALVQKLMGISSNQVRSPQAVNLNSVLTDVRGLVEQLAGELISVVYSLDSNISTVHVDPAEIEQLVLSFAINSRHAMAKGGTITVTTRPTSLAEDSVADSEQPGEYVILSVDDTFAGGISTSLAEVGAEADRTSKTSLPLTAIRAIVKSGDGITRFSTESGSGGSLKLYFPAQRQGREVEEKRTTPRKVALARTILIVEDDDAVRVPTSELLKMEGFKVLQAGTGEEAIQIVQQKHPALDVLITDVVMPKMTGHEVAARLLELHPGLKILYMSGDTQEGMPSDSAEPLRRATLRKPFRLEVLKDKIHELLGE
jgi:two-component system, cell cycle sensor histidine kinase and response regulator CckA